MRRFVLSAAVAMAAAAIGAADLSDPVRVCVDPGRFALWHTAPGSEFRLQIDYPAFASSARLDVDGVKYHAEYLDVTDDSLMISVPVPNVAKDENVYRLTLTFNDGTVWTARLGVVRGQGLGDVTDAGVAVSLKDEDSVSGSFDTPRIVLPIPCGESELSVNGETVDVGLDGDRGWFALGPARNGQHFDVRLGEYSASLLAVGPGFLLLFK